jgi:cell division transport system permease protein
MLGSLFFLIQESWLNVRRQGLMVLACVSTSAISLTILAVFVLAAWQVHNIVAAFPRQFEVHAFVKPSATRSQAELLARSVERIPGVARVRLIPREEAWAAYRKHYPHQEDLAGLTENPLPDKLEIVAKDPQLTLQVAGAVRDLPMVDQVNEGREILQKLLAISNVIRVVGLALAALLALGTTAIVGNAIRMTLYARRRDIRVMQLVGATNSFIRLPFVIEGTVEGAIGGGIACGIVALVLHYLTTRVLPSLTFVNEFRIAIDIPLFCAALVVGGALLGMFGSLVSLRRFLRVA